MNYRIILVEWKYSILGLKLWIHKNYISWVFNKSINYNKVFKGNENGNGKVPPKKYSLLKKLQSNIIPNGFFSDKIFLIFAK